VNGWHLVSEELDWCFSFELDELALVVLENVGVPKEVTSETTKDHDLILVDLSATCTLSYWELVDLDINDLPHFLVTLGH
jgi:hypothetical protein